MLLHLQIALVACGAILTLCDTFTSYVFVAIAYDVFSLHLMMFLHDSMA